MQAVSSPEPTRDRRRSEPQKGSILTREPLLLLGVLLAACYFGRSLLIPLALALTLCFLLAPLVRRLERMHLRRTLASLLALAAASALLGSVVWITGDQLLRVVADLPSHSGNIHAKLARTHVPADSSLGQALTSLEGLGREFSGDPTQRTEEQRALTQKATARARTAAAREAERRAREAGQNASPQQPTPVVVVQAPSTELAYLRQMAGPALKPLGTALMVVVFTVYLLIKREDLRNRLLLLAGMGRLNLVSHALDDAADRISRYLIANVSVNAGYGVVFGAGLYAIGIPFFALWGALLALLRTIPYAGPVVGGVLPILFALIYFPTWWQAGATLALIALLEILVSNFLEPWLYGSHTGISALALLAMAIVWTLLWGWPGLALSTPLTVCLIVVGRTMPQMSFLHVLLGDDAELAPEAHFYERMLAMDQVEAHAIAERFLESDSPGSTPVGLYDTVLLPALAMAENDRHKGALEEDRASLFLQSAAELISELSTYAMRSRDIGAAALPLSDAADEEVARETRERVCCPVVCVPASDQADEIAATMMAQLLEAAGHKTLLLPPAALTPDLLARFAEEPQTCLCISALPPFAFTSARALYHRLRSLLPENPVIVALWRSQSRDEILRERLGMQHPADRVVTRLSAALSVLQSHEGEPLPASDRYARSNS